MHVVAAVVAVVGGGAFLFCPAEGSGEFRPRSLSDSATRDAAESVGLLRTAPDSDGTRRPSAVGAVERDEPAVEVSRLA